MKCPLRDFVWGESPAGKEAIGTDCLQAECAWWLDDIQMCSIRDLALETGYLQQRLADLVDKMPVSRK